MIISGIDICFVAYLNSMAEPLCFNWLWSVLAFNFANMILMTVLLCLQ